MDLLYFQVLDDMQRPDRWFLGSPVAPDHREIDPRIFTRGRVVNVSGTLRIPLRRDGQPLDFTLADFGMPVLKAAIADELERLAPDSIQRFPVAIDGISERFDIINVVRAAHCLDEEHSGVSYWTEADGLPDLVGRYQTVVNMKIDPARTEGQDVFRVAGWEIALIVSERAKKVLENAEGAVFEPV